MRLLNRPLALILAVALAGASVIVIVEVIAVAVHASPVVVHWPAWYRWAGRTRWNAQVVRVWSAILIVVGVLILAIELKPRRITRLRRASHSPGGRSSPQPAPAPAPPWSPETTGHPGRAAQRPQPAPAKQLIGQLLVDQRPRGGRSPED